jgi:hypothetical protein
VKGILTEVGRGWARPITDQMDFQFRTADGVLLTTRALPTAFEDAWEDIAVDLEVREDGGLRLFAARIGDSRVLFNGTPFTGLYLDRIAIAVHEILVAARYLAAQTGHGQQWDLGVAVTRISGARAVKSVGESLGPLGHGYTKPEYRATTRATVLEMDTVPEEVVDKLLGRLARSLGAAEQYPGLFQA